MSLSVKNITEKKIHLDSSPAILSKDRSSQVQVDSISHINLPPLD